MIIINKKRIEIILFSIIIALLAFSFSIENNTEKSKGNTITTTSTPVSGKTVVIDAGHGIPDE